MTEKRQIFRRAVVIGTIIAVMVSTFVLYLDLTADPSAIRNATDRSTLPVPLTIFASFLFGMGLGTQLALLWSNWHRAHAILQPSKGRIICCIVLSLLAPVSQFWGIPIANGFNFARVIEIILSGEIFWWRNFDYNYIATTVLFYLYPILFYVFSCMTISGIKHRVLRIAVFGQIWLMAYGAVLMIFGFYTGNF